jgi:sulfite reductase beta subunit-like hemoprotein
MVPNTAPGGVITAAQLDRMADVADTYSRGWGHLTTRQNMQFHYVQLERVPDVMRDLASVGLTTREACGDTVRNVQGCHLAGACPFEVLDITPWAEATFQHFLRNPIAQRMPRKFKINFSGCSTDCGQAMFNDVGVIAAVRTREDGTLETGFRVYIAGGLGANPHPALALEEFTSREDLLPTIESVLRVFDQAGNRDNKLRARLKWLVDTLGFEELQRRIFKVRHLLLASSSWPGGIPAEVEKVGDGQYKVTGDLTLRGVTKEVVLAVEGSPTPMQDPFGNTQLGGSATTRLNRKDFGLNWSKSLDGGGVVLGDEVEVTIDIELIRK